jgi:hypothetical protein
MNFALMCLLVQNILLGKRVFKILKEPGRGGGGRIKEKIVSMFYVFYSFSTDYQLVVDARVTLMVRLSTAPAGAVGTQEVLWPPRHQLTLPLHGMNMLFEDVTVAINHHNKQDADR